QGCESSGLRNVETPSGSAFLEDAVHVGGLSHTSEGLGSQVLTREIALDQAIGRFTRSNRIGGCQSLHSRCDVGCFSEGKLLVSSTTTHSPHHDYPGVYPKSYRQGDPFGGHQPGVEGFDRL